MADGIPTQLGLNTTETEVYNNMTTQERTVFNDLPNNNSKTNFIRALANRDRAWREKSVCLAMCHIFC